MTRGARLKLAALAALACVLAFSASPAPTTAHGDHGSGTIAVDVRVWQHVGDPLELHVSARPAGARWDAFGTVRLHIDDQCAVGGPYRYDDVPLPGARLRVWQNVSDPSIVYVGSVPAGGDCDLAQAVRLPVDEGFSSRGTYRYGHATVDLPHLLQAVTVSPGGDEVPRLAALTVAFAFTPPRPPPPSSPSTPPPRAPSPGSTRAPSSSSPTTPAGSAAGSTASSSMPPPRGSLPTTCTPSPPRAACGSHR